MVVVVGNTKMVIAFAKNTYSRKLAPQKERAPASDASAASFYLSLPLPHGRA